MLTERMLRREGEVSMGGELGVHSGTLGSARQKEEHAGLPQQTHYYVESYIPVLASDARTVLGVIATRWRRSARPPR